MAAISPAVVISMERLAGSFVSSMVLRHSWMKGVAFALLGSLFSTVGYCLQNLSQKSNLRLPIHQQQPAHHQPLNILGILFVLTESLLEAVAFAFANESLLASVGLSSLAFNIVLSSAINMEKATYKDWVVAILIITGVVIAIISGEHTFALLTLHDIDKLLHTPSFHTFIIVSVLWTFALVYSTLSFDASSTSFAHVQYLSRSRRQELHRFSICALAGTLAGLTVVSAKGVVSLVAVTINSNNQFAYVGAWTFVIITILLVGIVFAKTNIDVLIGDQGVSNLVVMNHALLLYENLYVVPVRAVFDVTMATLGGVFFYKESRSLSARRVIWFVCGLSISAVGLGIIVLSSRRVGSRSSSLSCTGDRGFCVVLVP